MSNATCGCLGVDSQKPILDKSYGFWFMLTAFEFNGVLLPRRSKPQEMFLFKVAATDSKHDDN